MHMSEGRAAKGGQSYLEEALGTSTASGSCVDFLGIFENNQRNQTADTEERGDANLYGAHVPGPHHGQNFTPAKLQTKVTRALSG